MGPLFVCLRPFLAWAALFSVAINLLLLVQPLYMLQIFDRVLTSRSEETLVLLTVAAVTAVMVMIALEAVRGRLLTGAAVTLERLLGPAVIDASLRRSEAGPSQPGTNPMRDIAVLRGFISGPGLQALFDVPWLPVFVLLVFLFHPLLGALATVGVVVIITLACINERMTRAPLERALDRSRQAGQFADATLRNAEVIGALGMRGAVTEQWGQRNDAALIEQVRAAHAGGMLSGLTRLSRQLVQLVLLGAGAWLVIRQEATPGVMLGATIILSRALAPVETLVSGWRSLVDARGAWRRLSALANAAKPQTATDLPPALGKLDVERLSFAVQGHGRAVLNGVSFNLAPGESLGLIGASAAGKSTLARLLVGAWKPASGSVRLDGAEIASLSPDWLGPQLGYLPQSPELMSGTVAENIARMSGDDAAPGAVVRAAQRAHVHDMILRLPQGYETPVGEGGKALAAGQRQRIALARALYGDPRLVVLDEPNSWLDDEGDKALLATLAGLKRDGVTAVLIAHRPSIVREVDKLLVLNEGRVAMFGPRTEIMARVAARPVAPASEAA